MLTGGLTRLLVTPPIDAARVALLFLNVVNIVMRPVRLSVFPLPDKAVGTGFPSTMVK
jgi:hypothetical protein